MKIGHIRIYPNPEKGFDVILRVRGGILKHGTFPDIEAALAASWALDGRKLGDPVYVYERDFAGSLANALAPAFGAKAEA
ncbi:hypothetical protein D1114_01835 [Cereibacter sphaeroides]|uniref:DUF982 domain-containing protein n=2 Tax=Cereibacter sphaeroides TaxID=1063 RepID=A0AAX1URP2_CERSP|nr:hypothetical protein D1114_01835 [Cereibacter sphaeroides]